MQQGLRGAILGLLDAAMGSAAHNSNDSSGSCTSSSQGSDAGTVLPQGLLVLFAAGLVAIVAHAIMKCKPCNTNITACCFRHRNSTSERILQTSSANNHQTLENH